MLSGGSTQLPAQEKAPVAAAAGEAKAPLLALDPGLAVRSEPAQVA